MLGSTETVELRERARVSGLSPHISLLTALLVLHQEEGVEAGRDRPGCCPAEAD